jgi:NADPH:quinone reductase-like Zn-dependent oxidoreductase
LGVDGAGTVVAVGSKVQKFKIGDPVLGLHQRMDEGTFAEIASFEESELAFKPEGLCWQLAAAVPVAGVTALSALLCCPALKQAYGKHCNNSSSSSMAAASTAAAAAAAGAAPADASSSMVAASAAAEAAEAEAAPADASCRAAVQSVLILGASGGVGSFAVLLAKHYFKVPFVLATCSGRNAEYVRRLGADVVVDYSSQDVKAAVAAALVQAQQQQQQQQQEGTARSDTSAVPSAPGNSSSSSGRTLDLVIDNVGGSNHMTLALQLLKPGSGLYVTSVPLANPQSSSFGSVASFFARLGWRKALHRVAPWRYPAVAFNGASPDGRRVQDVVDWLAAAEGVVHGRSTEGCLVRLSEFELGDAGEALAAMQSRRVVGKLVLRVHGNL